MNEISARLEIEYPCRWVYKVIGASEEEVRGAILEIVTGVEYTVELSHTSSGGTYVSLNLDARVCDDEQRTEIYETLRNDPRVRMVL